MEGDIQFQSGIFTLPNEILLTVFDLLATSELLPLTPTCHQFHTLILRLIHNRLQTAAGLDGRVLYVECNHPSEKLNATKMYCASLGTDGLNDLLDSVYDEDDYVGQVKSIFGLYTRFRPHRREPAFRTTWRHPAGDVPGSRTYSDPNAVDPTSAEDLVVENVTVDAHDLFSQLQTSACLSMLDIEPGRAFTFQEVTDGVIRIWRDWLSKQCESKKWTDGESIVVHHEAPNNPAGSGKAGADSVTGCTDPTKDPNILWVNGRDNNLGFRLRVKEQQWRRAPILYSSDIEVPVSYRIEFEEILVRTTHLMVKLEAAKKMVQDQSGKAIVFGYWRPAMRG